MPGEDFAASLRVVTDMTPELVAIPELPARGPASSMTGRAIGLLTDLGADLQPAGWRLTGGGGGADQRRARSRQAQDLDILEEELDGFTGVLKLQVAGPMTLAASVERPRGDRVLADHGARRDLAQSLAEGVRGYLADVARRLPDVAYVLQIDEPVLDVVLTAGVPTASGWGRHRAVQVAEADRSLRMLSDVAHDFGGKAILHSCAATVPVKLVAGAGFDALSFDVSAARQDWDEYFDGGLDMWPGVVSSTRSNLTHSAVVGRLRSLFTSWGFEFGSVGDRLVITPTCGLAGSTPGWAREALDLCAKAATS